MSRSARAVEGSPAPAAAAIELPIRRTVVLVGGLFGAVAMGTGFGAAAIVAVSFELEA